MPNHMREFPPLLFQMEFKYEKILYSYIFSCILFIEVEDKFSGPSSAVKIYLSVVRPS